MSKKYAEWHDAIVERARSRNELACYSEAHHVIPRCFGGDDGPDNLVSLTYREHFLVHWLLTKTTKGPALRRAQLALRGVAIGLNFRPIKPWQTRVAAMAIRDLEADPEIDAARAEARRLRADQTRLEKRRAHLRARRSLVARKEYIEFLLSEPQTGLNRRQLTRMGNAWINGSGKIKVRSQFADGMARFSEGKRKKLLDAKGAIFK
jgi:hypothetical protein